VHKFERQFKGSKGTETVRVINPDTNGEYWEVYAIERLILLEEPDGVAIITGPGLATITAADLIESLANYGSGANVQAFIPGWEGQHFAFFNIARVDHDEAGFRLILGDWICGA
jgi:hypothetical protein